MEGLTTSAHRVGLASEAHAADHTRRGRCTDVGPLLHEGGVVNRTEAFWAMIRRSRTEGSGTMFATPCMTGVLEW